MTLLSTHASPLHTPRIQGAAQKAQQLLGLIEDLGVRYGLEHSFKFLDNHLLSNRFLVAFRLPAKAGNLHERTLQLCRRIDMPALFLESFREQIGEANIALFAFEENEDGCLYKAYLEFGRNFRRILDEADNPSSFQIHKGFKWNAFDNSKGSVAGYTCYPLLSVEAMLSRLSTLYANDREPPFLLAREMIERVAARAGHDALLYAEVQEDGNARHSFDFNVYRANIRLRELHDILTRVCEHYSIPEERFRIAYEPMQDMIFGHLSGGIDRKGRDFLTTYFGAKGSS